MKNKKILQTTLRHLVLFLFGLAMLFPFIWMLATSLKSGAEVYSLSLIRRILPSRTIFASFPAATSPTGSPTRWWSAWW
jgi:ABC-type glycerol-3-phosphate transport system permease component